MTKRGRRQRTSAKRCGDCYHVRQYPAGLPPDDEAPWNRCPECGSWDWKVITKKRGS